MAKMIRDEFLSIRTTPTERQRAASVAAHLGMTESKLVRQLIDEKARALGLLPAPKEDRPVAQAAA